MRLDPETIERDPDLLAFLERLADAMRQGAPDHDYRPVENVEVGPWL